jgi:hypothetical protein
LLKVSPSSPGNNTAYSSLGNSIVYGYNFMESFVIPNFHNLLFGKFVSWVNNAFRSINSVFLGAILHIIGVCAKKQMVGVHTIGMIAVVQNVHAFGYFSSVDQPRSPVCPFCTTLLETESSISFRIFAGIPYPAVAIRRYAKFLFKSFLYGFTKFFDILCGHVNPPYRVHLCWPCREPNSRMAFL